MYNHNILISLLLTPQVKVVVQKKKLDQEKCCREKRCLKDVLSVAQMRKAREVFCQDYPTYVSQREYILNWFDRNQPTTGEFTFSISGFQVCWNAFVKVLGITERRFFELNKDFLNGRRSAEHGSFFTSKACPQTEAAKSFLQKYFSENCDYMPNSNVWHLTSSSRKVEVYEEFRETMQATGKPSCSQSLFRRIWNTDFSHVKIPKVRALFQYKFVIQIVSK